MRRDKAALFAEKGVTDGELSMAAIAVFGGPGARFHTTGRGRHVIPVPSVPSHWLWMDALSARPRSLSPIAVDVRVIPVSPPVLPSEHPPLSAVLFAKPPSVPPRGRTSGPPSGTTPGPWVLRLGVLWWHRMPSSSQGLSGRGLEGPIVPVWLELVSPKVTMLYYPEITSTIKVIFSKFKYGIETRI